MINFFKSSKDIAIELLNNSGWIQQVSTVKYGNPKIEGWKKYIENVEAVLFLSYRGTLFLNIQDYYPNTVSEPVSELNYHDLDSQQKINKFNKFVEECVARRNQIFEKK